MLFSSRDYQIPFLINLSHLYQVTFLEQSHLLVEIGISTTSTAIRYFNEVKIEHHIIYPPKESGSRINQVERNELRSREDTLQFNICVSSH